MLATKKQKARVVKLMNDLLVKYLRKRDVESMAFTLFFLYKNNFYKNIEAQKRQRTMEIQE